MPHLPTILRAARSGYAATTATLALLVAIGGVGYAATALPRNSVGAAQIKSGAVTSVDVKNRSLKAADFARGQIPSGARGPAGPLLDVLPAGRSLTGAFALGTKATAGGDLAFTQVSFPIALPAAVDAQVVASGAAPTTECPGTVAEPRSAAGHLCVYVGYREGIQPTLATFSTGGTKNVTTRFGTTVYASAGGAGSFNVSGSWSVTAG